MSLLRQGNQGRALRWARTSAAFGVRLGRGFGTEQKIQIDKKDRSRKENPPVPLAITR
jgi:hypothetical protein